jgi:hypothetical protein
MGETSMILFNIRQLRESDADQSLELAYKAAYESGLVTTEFDKSIFNFKVKSIFVQPNSESFGMFREGEMVGFVVITYDFLPWNDHRRMIVDFMHIAPDYRNADTYQLLMDHIMMLAEKSNIKSVRMLSSNILLDGFHKDTFMRYNGFMNTDVMWEAKYND